MYCEAFGKDVLLDIICYRRNGHNELDEPSFTQPLMYASIKGMPSLCRSFTDSLIKEGLVDEKTCEDIRRAEMDRLDRAIQAAKGGPSKVTTVCAPSGALLEGSSAMLLRCASLTVGLLIADWNTKLSGSSQADQGHCLGTRGSRRGGPSKCHATLDICTWPCPDCVRPCQCRRHLARFTNAGALEGAWALAKVSH